MGSNKWGSLEEWKNSGGSWDIKNELPGYKAGDKCSKRDITNIHSFTPHLHAKGFL